ncbi:MAG: hypothetical protein ACE5R4_04995 [Armatimonadota bacterium]
MSRSAVLAMLAAAGTALAAGAGASAQRVIWLQEFGTTADDGAKAVCTDRGAVYVVGYTSGALPGQASAGEADAFIRKYGRNGNEVWTRQFGTAGEDCALGVCADESGVYVLGWTDEALPGQVSAGRQDAYVRKYDPDGEELWTRQFGAYGYDLAGHACAYGGAVYVAGQVEGALPGQESWYDHDAFVRKYDADGHDMWTHQFGTLKGDHAYGVCADESGVYVVGATSGDLFEDAPRLYSYGFARKYTHEGEALWADQFEVPPPHSYRQTSPVQAFAVSAAAGQVYIAGRVWGSFHHVWRGAGLKDWFIQRRAPDGRVEWTKQFGTVIDDCANGVCADANGCYVVGYTSEGTYGSSMEAYVARHDAAGDQLWTMVFGSKGSDVAHGVDADDSGVYVVGRVSGPLQTGLYKPHPIPGTPGVTGDTGASEEWDRGREAFVMKLAREAGP